MVKLFSFYSRLKDVHVYGAVGMRTVSHMKYIEAYLESCHAAFRNRKIYGKYTQCLLCPHISEGTKVHLNLFLNLIEHHSVKEYGVLEVQLHVCFISATDQGEWSGLCLGHCTFAGRTPVSL